VDVKYKIWRNTSSNSGYTASAMRPSPKLPLHTLRATSGNLGR